MPLSRHDEPQPLQTSIPLRGHHKREAQQLQACGLKIVQGLAFQNSELAERDVRIQKQLRFG